MRGQQGRGVDASEGGRERNGRGVDGRRLGLRIGGSSKTGRRVKRSSGGKAEHVRVLLRGYDEGGHIGGADQHEMGGREEDER